MNSLPIMTLCVLFALVMIVSCRLTLRALSPAKPFRVLMWVHILIWLIPLSICLWRIYDLCVDRWGTMPARGPMEQIIMVPKAEK
jgi:hypothetical protein